MLVGINYLHAKFQINILKNELLELWQLWPKRKKIVNTTIKTYSTRSFSTYL